MKTILISLALAVVSLICSAQETEFEVHGNGLIYDEATMNKLGRIVDSLNVKFRRCEPVNFVSLNQGIALHIELTGDVKEARTAIKRNISPEEFLSRFPGATSSRQWTIRYPFPERNNVEYFSLPVQRKDAFEVNVNVGDGTNNGWIIDKYEGHGLKALYLFDLKSVQLPEAYARLVQYVDCMIDTTAGIYLTDEYSNRFSQRQPGSKAATFLDWANRFSGEPKMPKVKWGSPFYEAQWNKYYREHQQWQNARMAALDEKMKASDYHRMLLEEAADEIIKQKAGNPELEIYIERYLSPEKALQMKRQRKVMGMCSQDQSPRLHAAAICRLAAKTAKWDIFLRAHLDIMNDNFSRMSDGSYAWGRRGTYFKELEELDIHAGELLIGTSLAVGNANANHYFGDIRRLGRALAETSEPEKVETLLLNMITDSTLDNYNRARMMWLFFHYNYNLTDDSRKNENLEELKKAAATIGHGAAETFNDMK